MYKYVISGMEYSEYYHGWRSFRKIVVANNEKDAISIATKFYTDSIIETVEKAA